MCTEKSRCRLPCHLRLLLGAMTLWKVEEPCWGLVFPLPVCSGSLGPCRPENRKQAWALPSRQKLWEENCSGCSFDHKNQTHFSMMRHWRHVSSSCCLENCRAPPPPPPPRGGVWSFPWGLAGLECTHLRSSWLLGRVLLPHERLFWGLSLLSAFQGRLLLRWFRGTCSLSASVFGASLKQEHPFNSPMSCQAQASAFSFSS